MKISDILSKDCVFLRTEAQSKRELLSDLSIQAAKAAGIDERTVADSIWERENLGSTGYGRGAAFPHARIEGLNQVKAVFARLEQPVEFNSIDHKQVDLIFLLISPENSGADHLSALASVSRILKDDSVCEKIRQAKSSEEIYALLNG